MQKSELRTMPERGTSENRSNLLDDLGNRLSRVMESSKDMRGLRAAQETIDWHIRVLEKVRQNVPDVRKPAISLIISSSMKAKTVVDDAMARESTPEGFPEAERGEVINQLRRIGQEA